MTRFGVRLALVVAAGACFGAVDALLVMQGGLWLQLGNVAALWLTVGYASGHASRRPVASAVLGALAESAAVVAFYGVKAASEGFPLVLAAVWLILAVISGAAMGALGSPGSRMTSRGGMAVLGLAWFCEPIGWSCLRMLRGTPWAWHGTEAMVWGVELIIGAVLIARSRVSRR